MRRLWSPSPWWLFLLAIFPILAFAMHFSGHMLLGWDTEPPLRPDQYLIGSLSAWDWRAYLGQPNAFGITQAPLALLELGLARLFGLGGGEKVLLTVLFVLPAFAMYACARRVISPRRDFAFVAALCYALCPLLFSRYYVPIVTVQLVYALQPLLVLVWLNVVRLGANRSRLLALAVVELLYLPGAANLAYWIVPHAVAVLYALLSGAGTIGRGIRLRRIAGAIVVAVLLNGFWFVPQVLFGVVDGPALTHETINKSYTVGVKKDVAEGSNLSYTLRMTSRAQASAGDASGTYWTYAKLLQNGLIAAPLFAWILLAALAILARPRDRRVIVLGALLCFAIFVMKGESAPFTFLLDAFYSIPLLGTIFRNGYDKLLPMAAISFALLLPMATYAFRLRSRTRSMALLVLGIGVIVTAFPYWTGQMFMVRPRGPSLATTPPAAALRFARGLDRLHARILFEPASDNPQLLATQWGFYGPNPYGAMTSADFIAMPASIMNTPSSDRVLASIYAAVQQRDAATFATLSKLARIGYVFVAHDMTAYYGGIEASAVDAFLRRLPNAHVVAQAGPYVLWKLAGVPRLQRSLVRRSVVGFNTTFDRAVTLAPQCGRDAGVLVALAPGTCSIATSALAQPEASPGPAYPVDARITRGTLRVRRVGDGGMASSLLSLPAGSTVATIGSSAVGGTTNRLSLVPCARYRVRAFRAVGDATRVPVAIAGSSEQGLNLIVAPRAAGLHVLEVRAAKTGIGASLALENGATRAPVAPPEELENPVSRFVFYAMPTQAYALAIGAQAPLPWPRGLVDGVRLQALQPAGSDLLTAPPIPGVACAVPPAGRAFVTHAAMTRASAVIAGRRVLIRPNFAGDPAFALSVPIEPGVDFVRIGDDVVTQTSNDLVLPTGAPVFGRSYRATGPARVLPVESVVTSGAALLRSVGRVTGSVAMTASDRGQWLSMPVDATCATRCVITVMLSSNRGRAGAALADVDSGKVLAARMRAPGSIVSLWPAAGTGSAHDRLYVYSSPKEARPTSESDPRAPAPDLSSGLQVASVAITPVAREGTVRFTIPRVERALPTDSGAILIRRRSPQPAAATAYVLDTQYDPFWTTLILPGRAPWVVFPTHVEADGFKNAWLVPAGVVGSVVHFYLLDAVIWLGVLVMALTLLALLVGAARERFRHGARVEAGAR